mmetsp:Transcript_6839/g.15117  ORF Transcript_6839/g.15117 Transcript_6839/m.15117 type:complete len:967 (+) Transcript_6839:113-3013(+)
MHGMKRAASPSLLASLLLLSSSASSQSQFVSTSGTKILDEYGDDLFFNGINLGNWLVWEGYLMMGDFNYRTHTGFFNSLSDALGGDDKAAEFEYQWRLNYVDEKAISDLSDLGFNSVRVPFNFKLFYREGQIVDDGFEFFDRVIGFCRTYGMYILLDMHGAPGYQNPGDHADNVDSNANQPRETVKFWDGNNVQLAASIWRHIAAYYKDEPVVWGYDLVNEPVPQSGREYELLPSYVEMRNAIREVDVNHIIVAEGSWWGSDLTKIDWKDPTVQQATGINQAWDSKLVYQIHHYGPASGTYGREQITQNLNIPIFIGEYGETNEDNLLAITDWAKQTLEGYFPWSFKKMSHDRCLWTIPPNSAYDAVKAYINSGGTPPTHLYPDMIEFAQVNIKNGHSSHEWHRGFYNAIKPTITCSEAASFIVPGLIQAEDYCGQFGVQLEETSDVGGGSNIGFLDPNDYTEYSIAVVSGGEYTFEARVASQYASGQIEVQIDGMSHAVLDVPNTNGWQSWTTISTVLSLSSGKHILRLFFPDGNFNLNWVSFSESQGILPTKAPATLPLSGCSLEPSFAVPGKIEAESYCDQEGVEIETTSDLGGGQNIGFLDFGDFTEYNIQVDASNQYTFEARVASEWSSGLMEVRVDGNLLGSLTIPNTGGWQTFTTLATTMILPSGSHRLRLNFLDGGFNLNWVKFVASVNDPPTTSPSFQSTSELQSCLASNAELQAQVALLQEKLAQYETTSPTLNPTPQPTPPPIPSPTRFPTLSPTVKGTPAPTNPDPTTKPTVAPTGNPTESPIPAPTKSPSAAPTNDPSVPPTPAPTNSASTLAPTNPTTNPPDCAAAPNLSVPGQFEAKQYCNSLGVEVVDGHITHITNGDYVEYNIDIVGSGDYTFSARINSPVWSGQINLLIDGVSKLWLSVPHTGGAWQTISGNIHGVGAGAHRLRVAFPSGGFKVDWVSFGAGTNNPFA